MRTHAEILALWPSTPALAADLGFDRARVRVWFREGRVPWKNYDAVLSAARRRGFQLTYPELAGGRPKDGQDGESPEDPKKSAAG